MTGENIAGVSRSERVYAHAAKVLSNHRPAFRRALTYLPTALAMVAVLLAYVFFASGGTRSFRRTHWDGSPSYPGYAGLAEGFLRGHLSSAVEPDPRLKQLVDPYQYEARKREGVEYTWDASYFNGKYYLYFSPLPVLLFYLPFRLIAKGYPPDALAATVFSAWAFVVSIAFTRRALADRSSQIAFPLWVVMIGLGNLLPFTLTNARTYEVSIIAGMALSVTWAYALLRFMERGTARSAMWMSIWLSLSIAARPNLAVLVIIAGLSILGLKDRRAVLAASLSALVPLTAVAGLLAWYNTARFDNPFEFGITYQLTALPMREHSVCGLCSLPEVLRFFNSIIHYLFWAPSVGGVFPFVDLQLSRLDLTVSYHGAEQVGGVAPIIPLAIIGSLFAVVAALGRGVTGTGARAGMQVILAAWVILLGLSACWYVVARYALDFTMLMTIGAVICVESGIAFLSSAGFRVRPLRMATAALACYSIVIGVLLGFRGPDGAFQKANPKLFGTISKVFK